MFLGRAKLMVVSSAVPLVTVIATQIATVGELESEFLGQPPCAPIAFCGSSPARKQVRRNPAHLFKCGSVDWRTTVFGHNLLYTIDVTAHVRLVETVSQVLRDNFRRFSDI